MGLQLNAIEGETIRSELEDALEEVEKALANPPASAVQPSKFERYNLILGTYSWEAGVMLYQQEGDPRKVREHLWRAGQSLIRMHAFRRESEPDEGWDSEEYEKALNLVVCFGSSQDRRIAAKIPRWQYSGVSDETWEPFLTYLDVLKPYLASGTFDPQAASRVEKHCLSDVASKEEHNFLLPKVRGLRAVVNGEVERWNLAIAEVVQAHEWEAKRGDYRLLLDGLICLPALMLAKLGQEQRMACRVASPYLPLFLFEA